MNIMVQVDFHATIKKAFGVDSLQVVSKSFLTVRDLLEQVCTSPERRGQIFDAHHSQRSDVTILKNGRNIAFLNGLDTELNTGDKVAIFPPVFGG